MSYSQETYCNRFAGCENHKGNFFNKNIFFETFRKPTETCSFKVLPYICIEINLQLKKTPLKFLKNEKS